MFGIVGFPLQGGRPSCLDGLQFVGMGLLGPSPLCNLGLVAPRCAWVLQVGFLTIEVLNPFVEQLVVAGRENSLHSRRRWVNEDLSSRPYRWLVPD